MVLIKKENIFTKLTEEKNKSIKVESKKKLKPNSPTLLITQPKLVLLTELNDLTRN